MLAKVANDGTGGLTPGNPVNFKSVWFNEGMQYTNGVFLIFDPGYYQITITLTNEGSGVSESGLAADIMVNNIHGNGFGLSNGGSLYVSSIVKLELYDSVNVRIRTGTTTRHGDANHFEIQKISSSNH